MRTTVQTVVATFQPIKVAEVTMKERKHPGFHRKFSQGKAVYFGRIS
jgi:hypothetical protein